MAERGLFRVYLDDKCAGFACDLGQRGGRMNERGGSDNEAHVAILRMPLRVVESTFRQILTEQHHIGPHRVAAIETHGRSRRSESPHI